MVSLIGVAIALLSLPARSNEIRYQAVWKSGKQPRLHTALLDRAAFVKNGQSLAEEGWRLIDVETAVLNAPPGLRRTFHEG